jgi:hypothetical protein
MFHKMSAIVSNASFQHDVPKEAELDSKCLCFVLSGVLNLQPNHKLRNSQVICKTPSRYLLGAGFQFREEFLLQVKCHFPLAAKIVHWEVSFEETFHHRFAVVALNVQGFRHRANHIGFLQVGDSHL